MKLNAEPSHQAIVHAACKNCRGAMMMLDRFFGRIQVTTCTTVAVLALVISLPTFAGDYAVLQVTRATKKQSQVMARINNAGEIVYMISKPTVSRIRSTRKGYITPWISVPWTEDTPFSNLQFPDISNSGEVVYVALPGGTPQGFTIYSNWRGEIGVGNLPMINSRGYIATENANTQPLPLAIYRRDRVLVPVEIHEDVDFVRYPVNLSPTLELTYVARSKSSGLNQLYSSTRGQVTNFSSPDVVFVAANDLGDFVYSHSNILYSSDGTILFDGAVGRLDMNNHGDVVFHESVQFGEVPQVQILLLTRRPKYFVRNDGFSYRARPRN